MVGRQLRVPVGGQRIEQLHCPRSCHGLDVGGQNRQFRAQFQQRALYYVRGGDVFPSPLHRLELADEGSDGLDDGGVGLLNLFFVDHDTVSKRATGLRLIRLRAWISSALSSTARSRSNVRPESREPNPTCSLRMERASTMARTKVS